MTQTQIKQALPGETKPDSQQEYVTLPSDELVALLKERDRKIEQVEESNKYLRSFKKQLEFRQKLDPTSNKFLSPTHKLIAAVLEDNIRLKTEEDTEGFHLIRIGKKPYKNNLMGMTGLSHKTIAETLIVFHDNGLIERRVKPGTSEKNFEDTEILIRFMELWKPGSIQVKERNISYARVCPHCGSKDIKRGSYVCHDCGTQFLTPDIIKVQGNEGLLGETEPYESQKNMQVSPQRAHKAEVYRKSTETQVARERQIREDRLEAMDRALDVLNGIEPEPELLIENPGDNEQKSPEQIAAMVDELVAQGWRATRGNANGQVRITAPRQVSNAEYNAMLVILRPYDEQVLQLFKDKEKQNKHTLVQVLPTKETPNFGDKNKYKK